MTKTKSQTDGKKNPIYKIIAYCKHCNRPRMIINGLCPGCLRRGSIVFDADINPTKLMALNDKGEL